MGINGRIDKKTGIKILLKRAHLLFILLLFCMFAHLYTICCLAAETVQQDCSETVQQDCSETVQQDCSETVKIRIPSSCFIDRIDQQGAPPFVYLTVRRDTLFVFDIDETLIRWNCMLERCQDDHRAREFIEEQRVSADEWTFLCKGDVELTELKSVVAQLREFNIPFIALTNTGTRNKTLAQCTLENGEWDKECICVYRYMTLKILGFESIFQETYEADLQSDSQQGVCHPIFFKGVCLTDGKNKGDVLRFVIQKLQEDHPSLHFPHVVMIDDRVDNLESVEEACLKMKRTCTSIRWVDRTVTLMQNRDPLYKRFRAELAFARVSKTNPFRRTFKPLRTPAPAQEHQTSPRRRTPETAPRRRAPETAHRFTGGIFPFSQKQPDCKSAFLERKSNLPYTQASLGTILSNFMLWFRSKREERRAPSYFFQRWFKKWTVC